LRPWSGPSAPPSPAGSTNASPPSFTSSPPTAEEAARLAAFLDGRADALLPILSAEARLFGLPADVFGIVDHDTYREAWPLLSASNDPWGALYAGAGVLVNEQMARRHDLSLGDPVTPVGRPVACRSAGSIPTTATPPARRSWRWRSSRSSTPNARPRISPSACRKRERTGARALLREEFGLPETSVRNQAQIKAFSLEIFENTFRVTGALNVLTLGVASLALSDQPSDAVGPAPAAGGAGLGAGCPAGATGDDGGLAPPAARGWR
jgi:putative ABC transport system permease protein